MAIHILLNLGKRLHFSPPWGRYQYLLAKEPLFFCFLTVFFFSNLPSPPDARISSACRNITKKINDRQHASYVLQVCITFSISIVFRCGNVDAEKVLYCLKTNWWLTYDLSLIISRDREVSYRCKDPWIKIWDANEYGSDPRNYEHYLSSSESKAWKKSGPGFEPMTSALPAQRFIN